MPGKYTHRTPDNSDYNYDGHQSPTITKNTRNLGMSYENSYEQKPEMHYLKPNDVKRVLSPVTSKASLSPIVEDSNSHQRRPEFYHFKDGENHTENPDHHSSLASVNDKRKSPISYRPPPGHKPEMYYLNAGGEKPSEYNRQSPYTNDVHEQSKLHNTITHSDSPYPNKITTYMIEGSNENNFPSNIEHIPSPPIHHNKKKQPVSFDVADYPRNKYEVSKNIRYVPLSKSKATESIERSMNKYRFIGN